ncbi:hypothetical protein [Francisella tularensis]|uniref:hypothetical protein n=1 Tax=Francisella tularensis TaxID=263 RepID=UPI0008F46DFD|nr:hypothetical protein [Francisella tularensis]APA83030.1 hypothetical protein N894_1046 [Francisella tularensis subsp. novicida PA10-7858]
MNKIKNKQRLNFSVTEINQAVQKKNRWTKPYLAKFDVVHMDIEGKIPGSFELPDPLEGESAS